MSMAGQTGSGRVRPLIYQLEPKENVNNADIKMFLKEIIPNHWRTAYDLANEIALETEYLTWQDRAKRLDSAIWEQARLMLNNDQITAVINRLNHSHGRCYAVLEYATFVGAAVSALLMRFGSEPAITTPQQAMTMALSKLAQHQSAARDWLRQQNSAQPVETMLSTLPGFSFALLTIYDNDTAESFMARDAFWRAMLGG